MPAPLKVLLKLQRKEKASELDAYSFYFTPDQSFDFKPGQYLRITLDGIEDPRGTGRFFTISSSPTEVDHIMITTRIGPSPFKQKLLQLDSNSRVEATAPFGNFVFDPQQKRSHVFIAGGIGLTPFRCMMKYAADMKMPHEMKLFVSYSHPNEIIFHNELTDLVSTHSQFMYVPTITKPEESKDPWIGETGRIDSEKLRKYIQNPLNCLYYICGPQVMVEAMSKIVTEMGIAEENVRIENFPGY